jgi:hypothetical protein
VIDVFVGEGPAFGGLVDDELAKFPKLILGVLALVGSGNTSVNRNSEH